LTEYKEIAGDGQIEVVRDVNRIFKNYLKNSFWGDLITVLPIYPILGDANERFKYFNLIKIYRIKRGLEVFDIQKIVDAYRDFRREQIRLKI
jgi:hypothetical protein